MTSGASRFAQPLVVGRVRKKQTPVPLVKSDIAQQRVGPPGSAPDRPVRNLIRSLGARVPPATRVERRGPAPLAGRARRRDRSGPVSAPLGHSGPGAAAPTRGDSARNLPFFWTTGVPRRTTPVANRAEAIGWARRPRRLEPRCVRTIGVRRTPTRLVRYGMADRRQLRPASRGVASRREASVRVFDQGPPWLAGPGWGGFRLAISCRDRRSRRSSPGGSLVRRRRPRPAAAPPPSEVGLSGQSLDRPRGTAHLISTVQGIAKKRKTRPAATALGPSMANRGLSRRHINRRRASVAEGCRRPRVHPPMAATRPRSPRTEDMPPPESDLRTTPRGGVEAPARAQPLPAGGTDRPRKLSAPTRSGSAKSGVNSEGPLRTAGFRSIPRGVSGGPGTRPVGRVGAPKERRGKARRWRSHLFRRYGRVARSRGPRPYGLIRILGRRAQGRNARRTRG